MKTETKNCQNCKKDFTIEPDDFGFYEKIQVPSPTFCPECRLVRRLLWRNDRYLSKVNCHLCGRSTLSTFLEDADQTLFCAVCYRSDKWNPLDYGQNYDFSKPFFEQFKELMCRVPQFSMQSQYTTLINSEYTMMGTYNRNCFMVTNTEYSVDCIYTTFNSYSNNCLDTYMCHNSELCYQCINVRKCSRAIFSIDCEDCFDISFSKNLRGCNNCFGCFNLRNKSYCFFNQQLTKEEYERKIKEYDTASEKVVLDLLRKFDKEDLKYPKKFMEGTKNVNVSGNYLYESRRPGHRLSQ